jgi:hypothetical protein
VGTVAFWCVLVSAGNNLGWVLSGGEFTGVFASMGHVMPPAFLSVYQVGLGLLLPISVGVLALVDTSHLVAEALEQSDLDERALQVNEQEATRRAQLKAQKKAQKKTAKHYEDIFEQRALKAVERAKRGDFSTGSAAPGVTQVRPQPMAQPGLPPAPPPPFALPAAHQSSLPSSPQPVPQPFASQLPII